VSKLVTEAGTGGGAKKNLRWKAAPFEKKIAEKKTKKGRLQGSSLARIYLNHASRKKERLMRKHRRIFRIPSRCSNVEVNQNGKGEGPWFNFKKKFKEPKGEEKAEREDPILGGEKKHHSGKWESPEARESDDWSRGKNPTSERAYLFRISRKEEKKENTAKKRAGRRKRGSQKISSDYGTQGIRCESKKRVTGKIALESFFEPERGGEKKDRTWKGKTTLALRKGGKGHVSTKFEKKKATKKKRVGA